MFKLNIIKDEPYVWNHPSHLTKEYLSKYGNGNVFIETGTYHGDTVKLALDCGFDKIYSCELNDDLYDACVDMFKDNPKVHILHGDSIDCLKEILTHIKSPATFWLDAHASGPLVGGRSGGSPVIDELDIILNYPIKDHTIFIDDRRLFGSAEWSYVKEVDAIKKLKQINPSYNLLSLDGHVPNDVFCATIKG